MDERTHRCLVGDTQPVIYSASPELTCVSIVVFAVIEGTLVQPPPGKYLNEDTPEGLLMRETKERDVIDRLVKHIDGRIHQEKVNHRLRSPGMRMVPGKITSDHVVTGMEMFVKGLAESRSPAILELEVHPRQP